MRVACYAVVGAALWCAIASSALGNSAKLPAALKCEFESYTSAIGEKAIRTISAQVKSEPGIDPLTYATLDAANSSAQLIGNIGAARVTMITGGSTWSFIEVTDFGNVNVTQVFIWDEPQADIGVYRAIHSRHSSLMGVIVASQHYGHCKALN